MFERKSFDPNIEHGSKKLLFAHIQALFDFMALRNLDTFEVPRAVGYVDDPERFCWWLVFNFPSEPTAPQLAPSPLSQQPLTLLRLLQSVFKSHPALEKRFAIAADICTTLHQLFSSSWMHKSIRSDNILFPESSGPTPPRARLTSLLVCGFEYSRLETEVETIDRSRTGKPVSVAMYRHPNYQGEAAQGYRVQYDVYSLGLVLLEIGLWASLFRLFDLGLRGRRHLQRPDLRLSLYGNT